MATTNELRVNIFFSLLFYFTKYNNMVVKSHIIKKKTQIVHWRSFQHANKPNI